MFPPVIASAALIISFLVVGLTVAFLAFGGGPAGARERLQSQTRTGRKIAFTGVAAVVVLFGVAIPILLGINNSENQSTAAPGGIELTEAQVQGRELFAANCATCHSLRAANAVGRVGPNLDTLRPPKELTLDAIKNGRARGRGQMPAALLDEQDARKVADFIARVAGR
jgi:cytochrome c553